MVELRAKLGDAVREEVSASLSEVRESARQGIQGVRQLVYIAIGISGLALFGAVVIFLTR